ncbi:MAG: GNAT family N-acetyltransferase [Planctomycetes bacterium]|nr:GNAT family N-acetyltransferase [Planctomycetota bacterium]
MPLRIPEKTSGKIPENTDFIDEKSVLSGSALIRELHTYGLQLPVGEINRQEGVQHQGLGKQLMQAAERIAQKEFQLNRMVVIAGVGVRGYYAKLGYRLAQTYMVKILPALSL